LGLVAAGIDALAALGVDGLVGRERLGVLARLQRLVARLDAQRLRVVGSVDVHGDAQVGGARDVRQWLRGRCGLAAGAATRDLRAARALRRLAVLEAAFAAGATTRAHVDVVARVATPARVGAFVEHEESWVGWARALSPEDFRTVVERACELVDGDGGAAVAADQSARRRLHLSVTLDGMGVLDGRLDPVSTEIVRAALERFVHDDRADDGDGPRRTIWQRRADALVELCRHSLRCDRLDRPSRRRGLPHVSVCVDLDVLQRPDENPEVFGPPVRAHTDHGVRLAAATLRRLTCDAHVSRILTSPAGEVLDVGRATRTVPAALWRALVARDRHCRHPGCHEPPARCDAHHLHHWADGGPTTLPNLQLLCHHHHRHHHERAGPDPPE
jgi:hypothetical protein